ncbi:iron ABC transporter ATP-binding protein [Bacillus sp. FJAT-44742]|uniref:iron ABC transporter ATP-binding protein n=1 Tax=Bacillus sp. FJAT-44742 TaxID=2014005 RepID=UPI000C23F30B|nr:ABC transporter ATP-binding protein [Bacillus sp. FJAT-44742]
MVTVNSVSKKYGEKTVVEDVSLTIEKQKITSFIGPNGAGKSTLLSTISRLIAKDDGEILIEDEKVENWQSRELAKKISILKQSNNVGIRLTVRELVAFGRFPYSQGRLKREDHRFIDEAIEYMGLTEIEDKYLDQLSGGQRQRAYISMVLAQDTEYILLDEPLNNLDMKHSVQIMKILRKLVNELGKTIVIVLHDINFASCYSDNIVAMKDGKIAGIGKKDDIIDSCALKQIYDMDVDIKEINNNKICVYYT